MDTTFIVTEFDVEKDEPITLVSPQNPLPQETIFLSNVDQAVAFPVETLFFFQNPKEITSLTSDDDISDRIKKAVSEILVPYYFMAGRLNFNHKTDRLEVICNNAGVVFVSAKSRLMIRDLGDLSHPNPTFSHFIHRPGIYKSLPEKPLFTIQVTKFNCGGFSIGITTNHGILDGKSASEMFLNLASTCRGEGLKSPVLHNARTCLKARNPPMIKFNHKEYIMLPKISSLPTSFTTSYESSPSPLVFGKKYDHKLFKFNAEMIGHLKKEAVTQCSSFEAIVAHIWRARTRAVFEDPNEYSTVLFAMDIRSIISPPLPNGFVGNAVITAFATSKVADLVENPISFGVNLIKEAKGRITEDYVRSAIDWLEIYNGVPNTNNGNFYVSAWAKLPFGDLDFGFGKPVHGGPVVSGNDEFVLLLSDGNGGKDGYGGGINVWMSLEHEKMNKFMSHIFNI